MQRDKLKQYDINLIFLSSMATIQYVSFPLLCHWMRTRKIEPKTKHLSHCKKNQSSWPKQTNNSKRNTKISNHAYKNPEKIQIIFIDKQIINPQIHRISTNTPQKKITQNRSPRDRGELCIEIQRERRSHLANNYGPEGLW